MHSKDPAKNADALYSEFFLKFQSILATAGKGTADFSKFVFPHLSLRSRDVECHCIFHEAVFVEDLHFYNISFRRRVDFTSAIFEQKISCIGSVVFSGKADFPAATFNGRASFGSATFCEDADFAESTFSQCDFAKTVFQAPASFGEAKFKGPADFSETEFCKDATFLGAHFHESHSFNATSFGGKANLGCVVFDKDAEFSRKTKFLGDVAFAETTFTGEVLFKDVEFARKVDFVHARFLAPVHFGEGLFRSDDALESGPMFALTQFSKEGVLFDKTNLSHALFHSCDLSNATFSSVKWPTRRPNGNIMVFDEIVPLGKDPTLGRSNGERDYGLIAQAYQQLEKNYDAHLNYRVADSFHYGEMEMRRRAVPTSGPVLKLRAAYRRHLGLIAWYRRGSNYGNSYLRPAAWLCGILLLFALLFPITGLQRTNANPAAPSSPVITYRAAWPSASPFHDKVWAEIKLVGKSFLTAIDNVTFQKSSEYTPTYPYGHALSIVESLLAATVFGLFLLAIRRQFRR
jgi:uncharacterized protein YjbI with pentapeptide repeats